MEGKDVWRSNSLVSSFFSAPYSGLGSVKSGTGAASFHNLVLRDGVIVPWVPEVLFFFREERAVKTERRKINLWSRRL